MTFLDFPNLIPPSFTNIREVKLRPPSLAQENQFVFFLYQNGIKTVLIARLSYFNLRPNLRPSSVGLEKTP